MIENEFCSQHPNFANNNLVFDTHFDYQILSSKYVDQVVRVFTQAFCRSEPMTHYLKMDEEKYKIFARAVTEKALEDQLSIICLDHNIVIACALVEDIAAPGPIPDFDPKFAYILALLEKLGEKFFPGKNFSTGHLSHLFITAVAENYRHRGLSTQVNFRAMDLSAQHGFEFVYCELTHRFNEYGILHHLKKTPQLIGSCTYQDFDYQGSRPFAKLAGKANSYLWPIKDNAKLHFI